MYYRGEERLSDATIVVFQLSWGVSQATELYTERLSSKDCGAPANPHCIWYSLVLSRLNNRNADIGKFLAIPTR